MKTIQSICTFSLYNNNVCQASTLSSEEFTKIKQVFFVCVFLSKTCNVELSNFQKKRPFELSAFAIKQT